MDIDTNHYSDLRFLPPLVPVEGGFRPSSDHSTSGVNFNFGSTVNRGNAPEPQFTGTSRASLNSPFDTMEQARSLNSVGASTKHEAESMLRHANARRAVRELEKHLADAKAARSNIIIADNYMDTNTSHNSNSRFVPPGVPGGGGFRPNRDHSTSGVNFRSPVNIGNAPEPHFTGPFGTSLKSLLDDMEQELKLNSVAASTKREAESMLKHAYARRDTRKLEKDLADAKAAAARNIYAIEQRIAESRVKEALQLQELLDVRAELARDRLRRGSDVEAELSSYTLGSEDPSRIVSDREDKRLQNSMSLG